MKTYPSLMLKATLVFGIALAPLTACTQTQETAIKVATQSVDEVANTLYDEKAYYGLIKGEETLNKLAIISVEIGLVKEGTPRANQIGDLLLKYTEVSEAAKQAKALNDAKGIASKIQEGKQLYTQITRLAAGTTN